MLGDRREKKEKRKRWKKRRRKGREKEEDEKKNINSDRIELDWNESCKGNSIKTRKLFGVGFGRVLVRVRVQVET